MLACFCIVIVSFYLTCKAAVFSTASLLCSFCSPTWPSSFQVFYLQFVTGSSTPCVPVVVALLSPCPMWHHQQLGIFLLLSNKQSWAISRKWYHDTILISNITIPQHSNSNNIHTIVGQHYALQTNTWYILQLIINIL